MELVSTSIKFTMALALSTMLVNCGGAGGAAGGGSGNEIGNGNGGGVINGGSGGENNNGGGTQNGGNNGNENGSGGSDGNHNGNGNGSGNNDGGSGNGSGDNNDNGNGSGGNGGNQNGNENGNGNGGSGTQNGGNNGSGNGNGSGGNNGNNNGNGNGGGTQNGGNSGNNDGGSENASTIVRLNDHIYINTDDNVVVYVDKKLDKNEKLIYDTNKTEEITKNLYKYFKDDFDFIFLVTNNEKRPSTVTYAGVFSKISNKVEGIGAPLYNKGALYGSDGNLQGVMHFAYRGAILSGPTLHEILHNWANKFRKSSYPYKVGSGSHWGYTGFFGGKGQIGGYDANTFRDENLTDKLTKDKADPKSIYSAASFGWNANGGNGIPYNDVELYLMGMIPKSDVKDLLIPIPYGSPRLAKDLPDGFTPQEGRKYFAAQSVERKTFTQFLDDLGEGDRNPDYTSSQKHFKVLTVLLDTKEPKPYQIGIISKQLERFTLEGDDGDDSNYNFYEATGGRGTITASGLESHLKVAGTQEKVDYTYTPEVITFHDKEYKSVRSPYTGRIWLDRNIGASKACDAANESECYGHYFEWGRGFDGHELPESPYTEQKIANLDAGDNHFVVTKNSDSGDWLQAGVDDNLSLRKARWSALDGSSVCPLGYRVPTKEEIRLETIGNPLRDPYKTSEDAMKNFLKLPMAGYRNDESGTAAFTYKGTGAIYWTIDTTSSNRAGYVLIRDGVLSLVTSRLAHGASIRCIKE